MFVLSVFLLGKVCRRCVVSGQRFNTSDVDLLGVLVVGLLKIVHHELGFSRDLFGKSEFHGSKVAG
jgi:hypothetical protein